jgi:hypothetical protein
VTSGKISRLAACMNTAGLVSPPIVCGPILNISAFFSAGRNSAVCALSTRSMATASPPLRLQK